MQEIDALFERELATFEREKYRLLFEAEGQYALIKGDAVISTYRDEMDAVEEGMRQFHGEPYLVKRIERDERPVSIGGACSLLDFGKEAPRESVDQNIPVREIPSRLRAFLLDEPCTIDVETLYKKERTVFEREKERLLAEAEGQYVLIKGDEIVATYRDQLDAAEEGIRRFEGEPYYVKRIERFEEPIFMGSL